MEEYKVREMLHSLDMERKKYLRPRYLKLGLTVGEGQPRILKCLLEQGAMTQRELADKCMLDVTTMSRTLDKLEKAGYLKRQSNPGCRRSYLVCITDEGREKAVEVQNIFRELDARMWKGVSGKERTLLYGILEKVKINLQSSEQ